MLEALHRPVRFVGCEAQETAAGKGVIFTMNVYTGMVSAVVQDAPHIRADPAEIEDIVKGLVHRGRGRDRIVVTVMGDI